MSETVKRHEVRYNDWYSAHRPVGAKEAYGDNHIQYGVNPDGSTYEVRPWKDPDNPEFAKLNPEYARLLRQQRDQRNEEARKSANVQKKLPTPNCIPHPPLSEAAREMIAMERHLQKIREGKASGGSGCGISKWELMAQQVFRGKEKAKQAVAQKAAEDQAWLNDVRARTATKNQGEIEQGSMKERQGGNFTVRVRHMDGGLVSDATADQAKAAAEVLLPFFRSELMGQLLSKMPKSGKAPSQGRAEISAYRSISTVSQALERGTEGQWHETHELKFSLLGGAAGMSYHSKHAGISAYQLESAGQADVAAAFAQLELLGVSLHIEPR